VRSWPAGEPAAVCITAGNTHASSFLDFVVYGHVRACRRRMVMRALVAFTAIGRRRLPCIGPASENKKAQASWNQTSNEDPKKPDR